MEVNQEENHSVTVINSYASSAEDEKVEQFYADIDRAMTANKGSLQKISKPKMELK